MGKHDRAAGRTAPISSNPLFPAVVALWFAALFGLGSLAVRPALIEGLVLQSHLDLILPAAAPPLGVTARILIALLLAALGAVIGLILTRRLARPAPVAHERKRGARDLAADPVKVRSRDAHPDAPVRRPISAHEELGNDDAGDAAHAVIVSTGLGAMANRRRALAIIQEDEEFVPHNLAPLPGSSADQPLAPVNPILTSPQTNPPVSSPASPSGLNTPLDWSAAGLAAPALAAQPLPSAEPAMLAAQRQLFQPAPAPAPEPAAPIAALSADPDTRQIFGQTPPADAPDVPRQIFGINAEAGHVPQEFVRAAGFQTSVFDTPPAEPLFGAPSAACAAARAPEQTSAPKPLPSPSTLGMTELAARLAESMRRRRLARAAAPVAPPSAADLPAVLLSALAEPAITAPPPPPPTLLPPLAAPMAPLAAPMAMPPIFAPEPLAAAQVAELPRFDAPSPADRPSAAVTGQLPAAMRPVAFDDYAEDDAALDLGLLPPRQLGQMPAAAVSTEAPLELTAEIAVSSCAEAGPEQSPADDHYASLLGLTAPRAGLARIDEPQPPDGAIEPVVIFPGQTVQTAAVFAAPCFVPSAGDPAPGGAFRRFDAPTSAGQGQPIAPGMSASTVDSAQADQALRAALANLQRMSGAA